MIRTITVYTSTGARHVLPLADVGGTDLVFTNITGIGPVKADIFTTNYGARAGAYYNGSRTGIRNIVFTVRATGDHVEAVRFQAYAIFQVEDEVRLVFRTDMGVFETRGYVESFEPDIFSDKEQFVVSVICPDPFFSDEGHATVNSASLSDSVPRFEFPFENPLYTQSIVFGEPLGLNRNLILYSGNAPAGMQLSIDVVGDPGKYIEILTDYGEYLKIEDVNDLIRPGSLIEVGSEDGDRYARIRNGNSVTDVSWLLYGYSKWPMLRPGENYLTVRGENTQSGIVRVSVKYRNLYRGI